MKSRSVWAALVLGGMLVIGCGGKKAEPPPPFVEVDGHLFVRVQGADGSVFFVEPKTIWLQKDGELTRQPQSCPICSPCDCRKPACQPYCMRLLEKTAKDGEKPAE